MEYDPRHWPGGGGGGVRLHKFGGAKIVIGYEGGVCLPEDLTMALWGQSDNGSGRDGVSPL